MTAIVIVALICVTLLALYAMHLQAHKADRIEASKAGELRRDIEVATTAARAITDDLKSIVDAHERYIVAQRMRG